MDHNVTSQASSLTAQKPSAGVQRKDSAIADHSQLQSDPANTQQLPLQSGGNQSVVLRPNLQHQRGKGRERGNPRPRPHEIYQKNKKAFEEIFTNKYYKKFFKIKAVNEKNLAEINVIKANRQLESVLKGKPAKVTELRDGSLLVELANASQSELIWKVKTLDTTNVEIQPHDTLNQIKGTIWYQNKPGYSEDDITKELKEQNVSTMYNVKRKVAGVLENTNIYIVTFDSCVLPEEVKIGWTRCSVREYIPPPRRCFKCNKYGHGSKNCRQEAGTCVICGESQHGEQCVKTPKCSNCGEQHSAASKECFYYKLEAETITLQTREKISYTEAKRKATQIYTSPKTNFSSVLAMPAPESKLTQPQTINIQTKENKAHKLPNQNKLPKPTTSKLTKEAKEQNTNSISTVISSRVKSDKQKGDNKRDGSALEEAEQSDAARKRANYAREISGSQHSSSNFPTPSPGSGNRPAPRERTGENKKL